MAYHILGHPSARMQPIILKGVFNNLYIFLLITIGLFIAQPVVAQVCIFPQTYEACSGGDCITDFESTSDTGVGANSSVNLDERRALAQAGGGAGQRAATAFVGVRIEPERTTDVEISTLATYSGVLQGGILGTSFGRVIIWTGLWNLTTDDIEVQLEVFQDEQEDDDILVLPEFPLDALTADFEATLVEGNEYAVFFRVETRARGLTSNSDFRTGGRGVFFDRLSIQPTSDFPDADGDGLFDFWEDDGVIDCNDDLILDLPGFGATSDHKDIFIEYDWLPGWDPVASSVTSVKDAFDVAPIDAGGIENPSGDEGIRLWIDTGDPATGDDLGGGEEIDPADTPNGLNVSKFAGDADGNNIIDYYDVKRQYFDENRRFAFHYVINGGSGTQEQGAGAGSCSDGIDNDGDGLVDGDDIENCFRNSQAELGGNDMYLSVRGAGILMHELGHNLGLNHGGDEGLNCKPNYISVMNYNMQNGIPQNTIMGQDIDADGIPDNRIVDYSPPRFPGGRGDPSLPQLDESQLNESLILDPTDSENMTVFIDAEDSTQTIVLDSMLDWGGDGDPPNAMTVSANINSGPASGCSDSDPDEDPFDGYDDWANIEMNFKLDGDSRDAPINPTEEPEPSQEELDDLLEAIYTTDLRITKTIDRDLVVSGQPFTINLLAENVGSNHTLDAEVRDAMPEGVEVTQIPEGCVLSPTNVLTCSLGHFREGETREFTVPARVRRDLECQEGDQFRFISNTATIENLAGDDPVSQNNSSTVRFRALCVNYEYAAKLVCGKQKDPDVMRLMRGFYGTMVNIHNPNDENTFFFKKLALAFPPKDQKPGRIIPIAVDSLAYDESLKTDCDELRRNFFPNGFPGGYIEGHVVVQSPLSLDVQSVFTAAPLDKKGRVTGVSTIDVEYIPERILTFEEQPQPDLIVLPVHPEPPFDEEFGVQLPEGVPNSLFCGDNSPNGGPSLTVDAIVRNIGEGDASPSVLQVSFLNTGTTNVEIPALSSGSETEISVQIPRRCYGAGSCNFDLSADSDADVSESDETNNDAASLCLTPAG